jgi:hypothetical protein
MTEPTNELAKISQARQMLAEAKTLPQLRELMEIAAATTEVQRRLARFQAAQGQVAEVVAQTNAVANEAAAVRIEAQARAGEMLKSMKVEGVISSGKQPSSENPDPRSGSPRITIPEVLGGSAAGAYQQAVAWQRVAEVPETTRQAYVEQTKAAGGEVTTSGLHRFAGISKTPEQRHAEEVVNELLANGVQMPSGEFTEKLAERNVNKQQLTRLRKMGRLEYYKDGALGVWQLPQEIPRMGPRGLDGIPLGHECYVCGGFGWTPYKPKQRSERGFERDRGVDQMKHFPEEQRLREQEKRERQRNG